MAAVATGLQGALMLAWGRPDGISRVEPGRAGAARSFWAAAICLPAFLFLKLIEWTQGAAPAHPAHAIALELLAYVIGWAGFALVSRPIAEALGRGDRWTLFLAAWNWCSVVQYLLLALAAVPKLAGAPDWLSETVGLVALFWAVWLEWYAARLSLGVGGLAAAAPVFVDLAWGLFLSGLTASLY